MGPSILRKLRKAPAREQDRRSRSQNRRLYERSALAALSSITIWIESMAGLRQCTCITRNRLVFPPQLRVGNYSQHLVQVEWFEEKMERPLFDGLRHRGVGGAATGHQDHLQRRVAALEHAKEAQTVAVRQAQIHESHGKFKPLHLCDGASHA